MKQLANFSLTKQSLNWRKNLKNNQINLWNFSKDIPKKGRRRRTEKNLKKNHINLWNSPKDIQKKKEEEEEEAEEEEERTMRVCGIWGTAHFIHSPLALT